MTSYAEASLPFDRSQIVLPIIDEGEVRASGPDRDVLALYFWWNFTVRDQGQSEADFEKTSANVLDKGTVDPRAIWLFDGMCGFCSWSVRFLLAHERDPSTVFVAIQSRRGRDIATRHGIDPDVPSTFLFIENDRALEKSDGLIALAKHLHWPWRALQWGEVIPKGIRDSLYDVLARNRYRILGRKEACELPPPSHRARFVLPE